MRACISSSLHPVEEFHLGECINFKQKSALSFDVNVSRGKTVCTESLTQALKEGELAGAGLDVTDPEPLPDTHPLKNMSNVVITPHIAGLSEFNRIRSFELIKQNVSRFVNCLPLYNVVNKQLGY